VKNSAFTLLLMSVCVLSGYGQTTALPPPTEHGMFVEESGQLRKIIGQIAEFRRSGSHAVNDLTLGLKAKKENIQLLGASAQTVVSAQPVFYFVPAKQEEAVGVNAGDIILIRLEEKSNRRQFEIAASGAWRSSSGITLTHQIRLLRDEVEPDVYRIMPDSELSRGEYALFLARGEGMAPYVYDFSVRPTRPIAVREENQRPTLAATRVREAVDPKPVVSAVPEVLGQATLGVFAEGNVNVRHDGVTLTAVTPGGPADQAGIKAGDTILAIDEHYLFTIAELREAISRLAPGAKAIVRYRRYSTILDVPITASAIN
jgi:membrane-associated protease RseP (regulator of RpoE activity)